MAVLNRDHGLPMHLAALGLTFVLCSIASAQGLDVDASSAVATYESGQFDQRYGLADVFEKATDNHGAGLDALYGTRNFRVVLSGVAYRGGANNKWHRDAPRDNRNPLPGDGLLNLCEEGFSRSFYLYSTNFDQAPARTTCHSVGGTANTLLYEKRNAADRDEAYDVLRSIYASIKDSDIGPVYMHCWNGWHASGLMAAKVLRQFCGLSAEAAVSYWDRNTDGHNAEPRYESIRRRIRDFEPYAELMISKREASLICPSLQAD